MVLDFHPASITHETNIQTVETRSEEYARELALLGLIPLARTLVSTTYHDGGRLRQGPFQATMLPAWDLSGEYPAGCPQDEPERQKLRQRTQDLYDASWGRVPAERRTYDARGLEACLDDATEGPRDAMFADATTGFAAMIKGQRLVKAFEISVRLHCPELLEGEGRGARLRVRDLDEKTAEVVKRIAARWKANQMQKYLADARVLWPLYARGLLVDALGLTEEGVRRAGEEICEVFAARLRSGFADTPFKDKTIAELVEIGNANSMERKTAEIDGGRPALPSDTFRKDLATAEEIAALEERLGVRLPDDYKEFLSVSNGFGYGEWGMYNGYFHGAELYDTSRVEWVEESWFQMPVDLLDVSWVTNQLSMPKQRVFVDSDWDTPLPLFDRVLQIGQADINHVWLIQPELVQRAREVYKQMYEIADEKQKRMIDRAVEAFAGSWENFNQSTWGCATWAAGGSAMFCAFRSFRQYLEEEVYGSTKRLGG